MTMVDRITPLTTEVEQRELADRYGICDAWPVVAEDFMQWVIEDKFVDDLRPNWEHVGALIVNNVTVYESMKIRVLNGGHSAISCGTPQPPCGKRTF
jgi:mannitol 2-dehydrogenase